MARSFKKYVSHCNGIDPFVTLMGNFDWGPISRNEIVYTSGPVLLVACGQIGLINLGRLSI